MAKQNFQQALDAFDDALRAELKTVTRDQSMGVYIRTLRQAQTVVVQMQAQQDQLQINEKLQANENKNGGS